MQSSQPIASAVTPAEEQGLPALRTPSSWGHEPLPLGQALAEGLRGQTQGPFSEAPPASCFPSIPLLLQPGGFYLS